MSDVFIAHVEEDAEIALEVALGLEEAGYTTWTYEADSMPGPSYLLQTGQAVEQTKAVVVIISPHSISSNQVTKEIVRAHESGSQFVPILRDITHIEFQTRQPEWREAIGAATSIGVPEEGIAIILPNIIGGLKSLGVLPSQQTEAAHMTRIQRELARLRKREKVEKGQEIPVTVAKAEPEAVSAEALPVRTTQKAAGRGKWIMFASVATAIVVVVIVVVLLLGQPEESTQSTQTSDLSPVAEFQVSALQVTPTEVVAGQTVNVQAKVKNTGGASGSYTAELIVDGKVVETREVNVGVGATETVSFIYSTNAMGSHNLELEGLNITFTVLKTAQFEISSLIVTPAEVKAGETATIRAEIENVGEVDGVYTYTLTVNGWKIDSWDITVIAGATEIVSLTYSTETAGTYILGVDGKTATLKVSVLYGKLTLGDAPIILDLSTLLPANFSEENPALWGMSNADMDLGPDFSEVELFVSDDPLQMIACYMMVAEDSFTGSIFDTIFQDDEQVKEIIESGIMLGMVGEGISEEDVDLHTQITHPNIGDSAIAGEGYISSMGITMGYDLCIFRENSAYVYMMSMTFSEEKQSLEPLAREIVNRIKMYQE